MAKKYKRAKSTKKKKAKKKAKKKHYPMPRPIGLQAKILEVMKMVPLIECTGQEQGEEDVYYYTEAAEVFRIYSKAMVEVGLTFVPISIDTVLDARAYRATIIYRLTDAETGQYQDVVAVGLGCNGVWALNSAQTVARKQALLNMFGASYPQPVTAAQVVRKAVKMFRPVETLSPSEAEEELKSYFDKEKQNERASDSRESVPGGKRSAKSRAGKNNPAKTRRSNPSKTS